MTIVFAAMTLCGLAVLYLWEQSFGIYIIVFGDIGVLNAWGDWQLA